MSRDNFRRRSTLLRGTGTIILIPGAQFDNVIEIHPERFKNLSQMHRRSLRLGEYLTGVLNTTIQRLTPLGRRPELANG